MDQSCIRQIFKVLFYIEKRLGERLTVDKLAKVACYSPFHFQRLFHKIMDESVYQYIKRRRLEGAAGRLAYSQSNITNIALDSGFETPFSFTSAFRKFQGEAPRTFRSAFVPTQLNKYQLKELSMIEPKAIETIKDLDVYFTRVKGPYDSSGPTAWKIMDEFVKQNKLDPKYVRYFGMNQDNPEIVKEEHLRYDACIHVAVDLREEKEVGKTKIKGGRYAIFYQKGSHDDFEKIFHEIFLKWLPRSGEDYNEQKHCFCEYLNWDQRSDNFGVVEANIFVPLK